MSASNSASKVNITDDAATVREKLNQAYCPQGTVEENGVLEYVKYLVFPVLEERDESFHVERPEKFGGDLTYEHYEEIETDFVSEELHPQDLKNATATYIADIVAPVREKLLADPDLLRVAYPETHE